MSQEALIEVIDRVIADPAFREQLKADSDTALASYDLTTAERDALLSGEPERLEAFGLEDRISKSKPFLPT